MNKVLGFILAMTFSFSANAYHLNTAQSVTVRNYIAADPALSLYPMGGDAAFAMALVFNAKAVPAFYVWATDVKIDDLYDSITWTNLTPADISPLAAIPATPTVAEQYAQQLYISRATICQSKQFALQILLAGRSSGTLNGSKPLIRGALQDALQSIPAGAGGANLAGGWPTVKLALQRTATVLEKLLATGTGSTASPATMNAEGQIGYVEIETIRTGGQ